MTGKEKLKKGGGSGEWVNFTRAQEDFDLFFKKKEFPKHEIIGEKSAGKKESNSSERTAYSRLGGFSGKYRGRTIISESRAKWEKNWRSWGGQERHGKKSRWQGGEGQPLAKKRMSRKKNMGENNPQKGGSQFPPPR